MSLKLLIVAGEASSDLHAAQFLKEFKRLQPELTCFGVGGKNLRAQGMEILVPASQISAFGSTDWLDRASEILQGYKATVKAVEKRRPDIAVLLDLPDFNLRLSKHLKRLGIPVIYYFSPQVWAWRKYRLIAIRKRIDRMLVAFPFEKKFYEDHGVKAEFVGHPVVEALGAKPSLRRNSEIQNCPRVALLPGSRKSEVKENVDLLIPVIQKLKGHYPFSEIRIPVASTLNPEELKAAFGTSAQNVQFIENGSEAIMRWADVALVASGTATLECAVIGTPFALFYRVSRLSSLLYKLIVTYKGPIGMPNILLGEVVAKEFFQAKANPEALWAELQRLIEDEKARLSLGRNLLKCRALLGSGNPSQSVALEVHRFLSQSKKSKPLFSLSHAPQSV